MVSAFAQLLSIPLVAFAFEPLSSQFPPSLFLACPQDPSATAAADEKPKPALPTPATAPAPAPASAPAADPAPPPAPPVHFSKPRLLTSWFAAEPRWPLATDLDGDGFADLVAIDPGAGIVDVARSVRGGKFIAPVNAAHDLGVVTAAETRRAANGHAELVLTLQSGASKVVAFGADSQWSVHEDSPAATGLPASTPPAGAPHDATHREPASNAAVPHGPMASNAAEGAPIDERHIRGDFDGDGAIDEIVGSRLVLAADPTRPQEVPLLATLPAGAVVVAGDVSGDHRDDLVWCRRDGAWRSGRDVMAATAYREGDADCDGDGLDAAAEARFHSDPFDADTDHDGLLDGWQ